MPNDLLAYRGGNALGRQFTPSAGSIADAHLFRREGCVSLPDCRNRNAAQRNNRNAIDEGEAATSPSLILRGLCNDSTTSPHSLYREFSP